MSPVAKTKFCRILLIDHPQFTHGSFFLWHGLKEIERATGGAIQVDVYPHIPTHYDAQSFNLTEMGWYEDLEHLIARKELPYGIPPFMPGETLTYHGQEIIGRFNLAQRFPAPPQPLREFELAESLNQGRYDLVILGNSHRVPTILFGRLKQQLVNPVNMPPVVYYDAGERDELNEHWIHVFRPDLVFKQILTPEVEAAGMSVPIANYELTMLPLPLSSIMVDYPDTRIGKLKLSDYQDMDDPDGKFLDIFYPMGNTWDARAPILELLDKITETKKLNKIGPVIYENYHLAIAKTRMALTMRGSGRDTLRYWEIPLYRTAMLSDGTMGCIHPYPFLDGITAVFWKDVNDLASVVLPRLDRTNAVESELRAIAMAGKDHLARYHSTRARALFFLDRIEEQLKVECASLGEVVRLKEQMGWDLGRPWRGPVA